MRVAFIRNDLPHLYLADVENSSQRNFSSEAPGQSLYLKMADASAIQNVLNEELFITMISTNTNANVDMSTTPTYPNAYDNHVMNYTLYIGNQYIQSGILITGGDSITKTSLAVQLSSGFQAADLDISVSLLGNRLKFETFGRLKGMDRNFWIMPNAFYYRNFGSFTPTNSISHEYWDIFRYRVYDISIDERVMTPTISVSQLSSNIPSYSEWDTESKERLSRRLGEVMMTPLAETTKVINSFSNTRSGSLYKMSQSSFKPGGDRSIWPAGAAVAVFADDNTPFTI